jgi:hypothetical protein
MCKSVKERKTKVWAHTYSKLGDGTGVVVVRPSMTKKTYLQREHHANSCVKAQE